MCGREAGDEEFVLGVIDNLCGLVRFYCLLGEAEVITANQKRSKKNVGL